MWIRWIGSVLVLSGILVAGCGDDDSGDDDDVTFADAAVGTPDAAVNNPDAAPSPDAMPSPDAGPTPDAGPMPDAGPTPDGAVDCTPPTGDYVEADDPNNNLFEEGATPEASGQSFDPDAPAAFTLGGCIDPAYETADFADADFYVFTLANAGRVRVEIEHFGAGEEIGVVLYDSGGTLLALETATANGIVIPASPPLPAGDYLIAVYQSLPSGAPYGYRLTVRDYPHSCTTLAPPADYTEANDGPTNRGNDVARLSFSPFTFEPTVSGADDPEPSGITAASGMDYLLAGTTADVSSPGDEYLDRDTFEFTTGAGTSEVHIILNWPDADVDMDAMLIEAGVFDTIVGSGLVISATDDEEIVAIVEPSTTYWLWIGAYDDGPTTLPQDYNITICAE